MGNNARSSGVIQPHVLITDYTDTICDLRSVGATIKFFVQPAKHASFCGAERLDPAVEQKIVAAALERDLLGLLYDGATALQIQLIRVRSRFISFRRNVEGTKKLANPLVQAALGRVVRESLNNSNR